MCAFTALAFFPSANPTRELSQQCCVTTQSKRDTKSENVSSISWKPNASSFRSHRTTDWSFSFELFCVCFSCRISNSRHIERYECHCFKECQPSECFSHSFVLLSFRYAVARVKRLKIKEEGRIRLIRKPKRRKNVAMKWKKLKYQEEEKTHTTSQCKQIVMFTILFLFVWYLDGMVSFSSASRVLVSFVFCVIRRVSNKTARML